MSKDDATLLTVLKPENMTIYEALELQALFSASLTKYQKIEVDLSQVAEIDSAGLQLLIALKNDALAQQKVILFTGHSREVIAFLDLFNMNKFLLNRLLSGDEIR